jgi:hypothetical protein
MNDEFKRTNPLDETHELPAPRVVHPTRARKGLQARRKATRRQDAAATTRQPSATSAAGGRGSER